MPSCCSMWTSSARARGGRAAPSGLASVRELRSASVEVISPSENHKRKAEKIEDYASIGVPEVWLCSPADRIVEVWRLTDGKLVPVSSAAEGILEVDKFPGVKVAISEIWPE